MKLIPTTRRGTALRFLLGALIVIGFTAATTAVAGLLKVNTFEHYLNANPALPGADIKVPTPGKPETILLIGSDHRAGESFGASNTDTMMLVRLDSNSSTINVLSIPRDLQVQIPEGGVSQTSKINQTYSIGGPNLLIKVLKTEVFPGLKVNHIIDINFRGFSDLIDAIGCVYTDVDHRYYNNTALTDYSSIDIQAGYQRLCGNNQSDKGALAFVRFRHTDNDLVRNARQQDFIRWAKDAYPASRLLGDQDKLLKIFGKNTTTDHNLHTTDGLINLFDLVAFSAGHSVKQIPFPAEFSPCGGGVVNPVTHFVTGAAACYVTASANAEQHVFNQFMTPTAGAASPSSSTSSQPRHSTAKASSQGLINDPADGAAQATALGRAGMPIYYPTKIVGGTEYCSSISGNCNEGANAASEYIGAYPRQYRIHDASGHSYASYRMTLVKNSVIGQYYGVQGTTWKNPPILIHPTQTQTVNGKNLMEYFNGRKLALVAWVNNSGAYWVSNTLTDDIPPKELVAIAASLRLKSR